MRWMETSERILKWRRIQQRPRGRWDAMLGRTVYIGNSNQGRIAIISDQKINGEQGLRDGRVAHSYLIIGSLRSWNEWYSVSKSGKVRTETLEGMILDLVSSPGHRKIRSVLRAIRYLLGDWEELITLYRLRVLRNLPRTSFTSMVSVCQIGNGYSFGLLIAASHLYCTNGTLRLAGLCYRPKYNYVGIWISRLYIFRR